MPSFLTELFSSVMALFYKGYIVLLNIQAPFRMTLLILLSAIVLFYAIKITLSLINWLAKSVLKLFEAISNGIGQLVVNRRKLGKRAIPGVGLMDFFVTLFIKIANKVTKVTGKIAVISPKMSKIYRVLTILCALILPSIAMFQTDGAIAKKWTNFEQTMIKDKLIVLGYDASTYKSFETFQQLVLDATEDEVSETAAKQQEKKVYITPNAESTKGVNIRKKTSTKADVLDVLEPGELLLFTGNQVEDSTGLVWYELQHSETVTGWVSSKVVDLVEK